MKRSLWLLLLFAMAVLCGAAPALFAQEKQLPAQPRRYKPRSAVFPLKNAKALLPQIMTQSAIGSTVPLWSYSLVSPFDNKSYSGQMVGRSPLFHGQRTTTVKTYLVPVILTFADTGIVFDPTTNDACLGSSVLSTVQNSPIFQTTDYIMNGVDVGSAQYIDAFQRANFWTNVSVAGNSYHTVLGLTTLPAVKVTVPVANGQTNLGIFCGFFGNMDINWWDNYVQTTLIPSLASKGVGPTNLPLFLFDSVVEYLNGDPNQCCVFGYHNSYTPNGVLQTYSISNFDTTATFGGDIGTLSHEVGEWMDDPLTTNPTPAWGNTGQVSGCQNNLEVGDPLSGTLFPSVTMNNFTYNPQELAFFSWFYRQAPSIGAGGAYSNNSTFTSGAATCP